jgi:hypothetical protein
LMQFVSFNPCHPRSPRIFFLQRRSKFWEGMGRTNNAHENKNPSKNIRYPEFISII